MAANQTLQTDREYPRFKFAGFGSEGTCYLRTRVRPSGLVVLCAQLLNYHGTSVTNAAEHILQGAIERLQRDVGLNHLASDKPWWRFRDRAGKAFEQIVRRTVWVEHYPPGAGMSPNGSYALVAFDSDLHPVWNYVDKEVAASESGVDLAFLDLDRARLMYGS